MPLQKLLELFSAEDVAASSLVLLPVSNVVVWVVPQKVGYDSLVGDIGWLGKTFHLFEAMHVFGNASVHAHDLLVDQGHQGHVVEAVDKLLEERYFVPSLDLVEKAVNPGDGLALVVASQNYDLLREPYFKGEEQTDHLARLLASVDVITHE